MQTISDEQWGFYLAGQPLVQSSQSYITGTVSWTSELMYKLTSLTYKKHLIVFPWPNFSFTLVFWISSYLY